MQPVATVLPPGYRVGPEPTPPPLDQAAAKRVYKLAQFVVKNGVQFEQMMKAREANNPLVSILAQNQKYVLGIFFLIFVILFVIFCTYFVFLW